MIKRIAVTGPESTGKSELAEKLADFYVTTWVPEYSREYLDHLGRAYRREDILEIAKGQLKREEEAFHNAHTFLFCDTELIVTKIWSDFMYGSHDPWIAENITTHPYDLYLLCYVDIPWKEDPLREHPQYRELLFHLYYQELKRRGACFEILNGLGEERLIRAIKYIEKRFGRGNEG